MKKKQPMQVVAIRFDSATLKALRAVAKSRGVSLSTLIRNVLAAELPAKRGNGCDA